jgi:tRNA threonylcarbamoyladenosine biosynthesis protein TsaB
MAIDPTRILAVDTATESCSAACLVGGEIYERRALDPQGHSRLLLGMIEEVLSESRVLRHELDAIVYDAGPGSFTGIRIGAGVAQGLAMGLKKPLLSVSSLMTLAEAMDGRAKSKGRILAAIDARMEQVYWGCLEQDEESLGGWYWHEHPRVSDPAAVRELVTGCTGIGSGWDRYAAVFQSSEEEEVQWHRGEFPTAAAAVRIASRLLQQGVKGGWHEAAPTYVRNDVTG